MLPPRAHGEMDGRREMIEKTLLQERETAARVTHIIPHSRARSLEQGPTLICVLVMGVNVCDIGNVWANVMNQTLFLSKRQQKKPMNQHVHLTNQRREKQNREKIFFPTPGSQITQE